MLLQVRRLVQQLLAGTAHAALASSGALAIHLEDEFGIRTPLEHEEAVGPACVNAAALHVTLGTAGAAERPRGRITSTALDMDDF